MLGVLIYANILWILAHCLHVDLQWCTMYQILEHSPELQFLQETATDFCFICLV